MKLLVSDYDGTLYDADSLRETRRNIDAIKRFKDNGNMFAIATARIFPSIKGQTEKFKIPYDYLICCDGGCVFDKNDNLIYSNPIEEQELLIILKYLKSLSFVSEIRLLNSHGQNTTNTKDTHQIFVQVHIKKSIEILRIKKALAPLEYYGFIHMAYFYKHTEKTDGIKLVAELEHLKNEDIYTIGNGNNDIAMLKEYNGSRVPYSYPRLVLERIPKNSISTFIKKIESGNI